MLITKFRLALKEAHPGVTDAEIDRYEELVAARFQIDPDREPDRLARSTGSVRTPANQDAPVSRGPAANGPHGR